MFAENEVTSPARSFLLRVEVDGFSAMTLDQQLAVWGHDRRLVAWLIVTGRVRPTAEYLGASKLRVGKVAAGVYREFHERFLQIAGELGFDPKAAELQWWAVAKVAALAGVWPERVTKAQLDTGREQLIAATRRLHPDHPMRAGVPGRAGHRGGCRPPGGASRRDPGPQAGRRPDALALGFTLVAVGSDSTMLVAGARAAAVAARKP